MSDWDGSALIVSLDLAPKDDAHSRRAVHPPLFTSGLETSPTFPGASPARFQRTPWGSSFPVNSSKPPSLNSMAGVTKIVDGKT